MTLGTTNGRHAFAFEDEASHFAPESHGFASGEEEWEGSGEWEASHFSPETSHFAQEMSHFAPESHGFASGEEEWEGSGEWEASHFSPESNPFASGEWEGTGEDEWESSGEWESNPFAPEASHFAPESHGFATGEAEWEGTGEWEASHFSTESNPFSSGEEEWEGGSLEDESDQFLPFLAPLAMKALPMIARYALPAVKRLLPIARQAIGNVVRNVTSTPLPNGMRPVVQGIRALQGGPGPRPMYRRAPSYGPPPTPIPAQPTIGTLLRQLSQLLNVGEAVAAEAEASYFGTNEMHTELGAHENAHEAALTEVLAAEAAHATTEAEAEALLGSALPITIRIMGGPGSIRPLIPTLTRSNARLVSSIRRSGPGSQQLLRAVPAIQRRTIASIRAARRAGRPVGPRMVPQIMAGQAARVLGTPHICGRALLRNAAIRRGTVAPVGRVIRPIRTF
jgi:hypothetical protein